MKRSKIVKSFFTYHIKIYCYKDFETKICIVNFIGIERERYKILVFIYLNDLKISRLQFCLIRYERLNMTCIFHFFCR